MTCALNAGSRITRLRARATRTACAVFVCGITAASAAPAPPLRIEDALTEVHVADATLSPDGTLLAYVACRQRPRSDDAVYLPSGFYRSHAGCTLHPPFRRNRPSAGVTTD